MFTVIFIVAMLIMWGVFGQFAFTRRAPESMPVRRCPFCGFSGRVIGFGRFRCIECRQHFVLGATGRPAQSMASATLPWLLLMAVFLLAATVWWVRDGANLAFCAPVVFGVGAAILLFEIFRLKRFPNVDSA
jgi:hypothetical protein